jgi:hypothetical protein
MSKRFAVAAYKGVWPYKGYGDAWRAEFDELAPALALFGAHAISARTATGGHVGLNVDGIEVLAYEGEQLFVATEISLVPGPHAFEPDKHDAVLAGCKYCGQLTDTRVPQWWLPGEVCPKKPTQETWRQLQYIVPWGVINPDREAVEA